MMTVDISGMDELIKQCEELATLKELEDTDRIALKKCGSIAKSEASKSMLRSKDVSKSGRKGSRTYQHSADNVPMKLNKKQGKYTLCVGWDKGDISPYFYVKFEEFGSSKQRPHAPFKKTFVKQIKQYNKIFQEEYEKLVEKKLNL